MFLLVFRIAPAKARSGVLLGASLLFYTMWLPAYLLLLLGEIAINYALLRAIVAGRRPRLALTASIVFTLGILLNYKNTPPS